MPRIFLSFRKTDSRWLRDRIHQALTARFGTVKVFKSGESIPPGADFAEILRQQATECELMFVLIGPAWLDARGADGGRLLDREADWVRVEIGTALRAGNRVVPVLLGDAVMLPAASALPTDIAAVAGLQFLRVAETHVDAGLDRLNAAVAALLPDLGDTTSPITPEQPVTVTMTAHVSGRGNAFQAGRDQAIRIGEASEG